MTSDDPEISCEELSARLASGEHIRLVDCREPFEHQLVRLADCELVPMNQTPEHLDDYRACERPQVVYCHHGMRSLQVVRWLREQGIENVRSLAGGIDYWSVVIDTSVGRY